MPFQGPVRSWGSKGPDGPGRRRSCPNLQGKAASGADRQKPWGPPRDRRAPDGRRARAESASLGAYGGSLPPVHEPGHRPAAARRPPADTQPHLVRPSIPRGALLSRPDHLGETAKESAEGDEAPVDAEQPVSEDQLRSRPPTCNPAREPPRCATARRRRGPTTGPTTAGSSVAPPVRTTHSPTGETA